MTSVGRLGVARHRLGYKERAEGWPEGGAIEREREAWPRKHALNIKTGWAEDYYCHPRITTAYRFQKPKSVGCNRHVPTRATT